MGHSRRAFLGLGLATVLVGASGCSDDQTTAGGDDQVEVISWWSDPGEAEGLNALIDNFKVRQPGIQFVNLSVGGGAGANSRAVVQRRMEAGDPPDSYQAGGGIGLADDVRAGWIENIDDLYDDNDLRGKFPAKLLEAIKIDGKLYSVPLNIHRANLIWYNPKVLARAGIGAAPTTWTELLAQTTAFRAIGVTPVAVGPLWTQKVLLENILLGELGADQYAGLWKGTTDWRSPKVKTALTAAARVFASSDVKSPSSEWQSTLAKTLRGEAAYTVLNDASYSQALRSGLTYKADFDVAVAPGTAGVYNFFSDTFTLPKGAANPGAARKWLLECASASTQEAFTQLNGSLPARVDTTPSKYTGYLSWAMSSWNSVETVIVGSLTHGAATGQAVNSTIDEALTRFTEDQDPDAFVTTVASGFQAAGS